jgi:hypothetical protein
MDSLLIFLGTCLAQDVTSNLSFPECFELKMSVKFIYKDRAVPFTLEDLEGPDDLRSFFSLECETPIQLQEEGGAVFKFRSQECKKKLVPGSKLQLFEPPFHICITFPFPTFLSETVLKKNPIRHFPF